MASTPEPVRDAGILTEQDKAYIDSLTYDTLLDRWRFAPAGDRWFIGERADYWAKRMSEFRNAGVDHVGASKRVGWNKGASMGMGYTGDGREQRPIRAMTGIYEDIATERARQDAKWGRDCIVHRSSEEGYRVLGEESGEVAKAINERKREQCRVELIHTAAVAVCMIEAIDAGAPLVRETFDFNAPMTLIP